MKRAILVSLLSLACLIGCQKDSKHDDPIPSQSIPDISGNYSGLYSSNLVSPTLIAVTFSQNGTALAGSFTNGTVTGSITGTVGLTSFTMTIVENAPCPGTLSGAANINGTSLVGAFTGNDCLGTHTSGSFNVNKI